MLSYIMLSYVEYVKLSCESEKRERGEGECMPPFLPAPSPPSLPLEIEREGKGTYPQLLG